MSQGGGAPIGQNDESTIRDAVISQPMTTDSTASYWNDPCARQASLAGRSLRFGIILAAHALLLWGGLELAARPETREAVVDLMVRLVEVQPPKAETPTPPVPPKPRKVRPAPPPPIIAAAPKVEAPPVAFSVPPQPPPPPAVEAVPPPMPVVTAARFDADYLSNPKPAYPLASRRLGEEGKVVLRVHVSAAGAPMRIEIKHSCGFARLDKAAKSAVERWRFVPARRGDEAIESWVAVPIVFSLRTS